MTLSAILKQVGASLITRDGKAIDWPLIEAVTQEVADAWPKSEENPMDISAFPVEQHGDLTFQAERLADIVEEMRVMHELHWRETEVYRHALQLNFDYERVIAYEKAGRYVLFTIRKDGKLVGNFAAYLTRSTHTQSLMATEDTLYVVPELRGRGIAKLFHNYIEKIFVGLGAKEIIVTVKKVNSTGKLLEHWGFQHVAEQYVKVIGG